MIEFRIFNIHVTIEPWHWLILAFLGGAFNIGQGTEVIEVVLFMLAGVISILVHELGHALLIRKYGQPTEIVLTGMGGYATHPPGVFSRTQSFLVSFAGPALQILLGFTTLGLIYYSGIEFPSNIDEFLKILMIISFYWAILNLLPIYPLDGGQMLGAALGNRRQHITHIVSIVVAILVVIYLGITSGGFSFFMIFAAYFAFENWKLLEQIKGR